MHDTHANQVSCHVEATALKGKWAYNAEVWHFINDTKKKKKKNNYTRTQNLEPT